MCDVPEISFRKILYTFQNFCFKISEYNPKVTLKKKNNIFEIFESG